MVELGRADVLIHLIVNIPVLVFVLEVEDGLLELSFLASILSRKVFPDDLDVKTWSVVALAIFTALVEGL